MRNAVAFANNDVATIAWSYGAKPEGCMGFALYRIDSKEKETVLPSHAVFPVGKIATGQTTLQFPIQKFYWKDVYARLVGDKTGDYTFRYKVVPLEGPPDALKPMASLPILTTNEVTISGVCSPSLTAIFNRGLISTQHVSRALKGKINANSLKAMIAVPMNQLRKDLGGDIIGTLTGFVARAKRRRGAVCVAIRTDGCGTSAVAGGRGQNAKPGAGEYLGEADAGRFGGNCGGERRFGDEAKGVGGDTALPAATKRAYRAQQVFDLCRRQWNAAGGADRLLQLDGYRPLRTDEQLDRNPGQDGGGAVHGLLEEAAGRREKAHETGNPFQDTPLRTFNGTGKDLNLDKGTADASTLTSYFSPNTPKQRSKGKGAQVFPVDMKDLSDRIMAAKNAVLFLAFIPGTPSITEFAAAAQKANKDLFVRGCVTSPDAAGNFYYDLKGTSPPKKQKGVKNPPAPQDARVISAKALGKTVPVGWQKELLNAGFAITHDKIVVIDPFANDCVVVTGSHNLGYQASYNNDENLVMIEGNKKLAMAYTTHVLDVYDHFSWRWTVSQGTSVDANLKTKPDDWLNWYFDARGNIKTAQLKFWMQATV